jgi:HTH-type transcriptional regulator / antitoxin HigA
MARPKPQFKPDYAIQPGEILEEMLDARRLKKTEFAKRCGRPQKTISGILNGHVSITPETAIQFERVLGTPAALWTNLEANYRLRLAEREAASVTKRDLEWAKAFPLAELIRLGFLDEPKGASGRVRALLEFFGVASVDAWNQWYATQQAAYRKSPSFKSAGAAVAAWLRMGEKAAEEVECRSYDRERFLAALKSIRSLTVCPVSTWNQGIREHCAEAGVAFVLVRELPKTRLSGATRWLSKEKALIQLSLRHRTDDHFWFSFFHEAGHIVLHGKKQLFLDDVNHADGEEERQADRFAADSLIDASVFDVFASAGDFYPDSIQAFAAEQGIAPGIVVGRLQHDGLVKYQWHNRLKIRLKWADD